VKTEKKGEPAQKKVKKEAPVKRESNKKVEVKKVASEVNKYFSPLLSLPSFVFVGAKGFEGID
jgi:hypothetical protein